MENNNLFKSFNYDIYKNGYLDPKIAAGIIGVGSLANFIQKIKNNRELNYLNQLNKQDGYTPNLTFYDGMGHIQSINPINFARKGTKICKNGCGCDDIITLSTGKKVMQKGGKYEIKNFPHRGNIDSVDINNKLNNNSNLLKNLISTINDYEKSGGKFSEIITNIKTIKKDLNDDYIVANNHFEKIKSNINNYIPQKDLITILDDYEKNKGKYSKIITNVKAIAKDLKGDYNTVKKGFEIITSNISDYIPEKDLMTILNDYEKSGGKFSKIITNAKNLAKDLEEDYNNIKKEFEKEIKQQEINTKKNGGKIYDQKGYLISNLNNFTPKKIITGNENGTHITTKGMAFPVIANGNLLYPNTGEYYFKSKEVEEIPFLKKGGKVITLSSGKKVIVKAEDGVEINRFDLFEKKFQDFENRFLQFEKEKNTEEEIEEVEESNISNNKKFNTIYKNYNPLISSKSTTEDEIKLLHKGIEKYGDLIDASAEKYNVPRELLIGLLFQESKFNPNAIGPNTKYGRAKGIAQFIDDTARERGVNSLDPKSAIPGAASYLRHLYNKTGDWNLALASYNAGYENVEKYNGIPPFKETRNYVKEINRFIKTVTTLNM